MTINCISPIDGSIFVSREKPFHIKTHVQLRYEPRLRKVSWAALPLSDRIALVRAGVAAVGAMNDEIVPEIAWQMGRPVRYGGGVFRI